MTTIKSNTMDRLMVVLTAAGLVVIALCIHMVSLVEFESSACGSMAWFAALMLAIYISVGLWRGIGAIVKFFVSRFSSDKFKLTPPESDDRLTLAQTASLALNGQLRWSSANVRSMLRLLAAATMLAVALGMASLAAMFFAGQAVDAIGSQVVWNRWTFELYRFVAELVCMFPLAMGMAGVFYAGAMLRCGMGRDVYAAIFRDWLIGIGAGLMVFAAGWLIGMNVVGLACVVGIFLLAGAATVFIRRQIAPRGGKFERQPIDQKVSGRWTVATVFGVLTLAAMLQLRLIADATHIGFAGRMIWLAVNLIMLAGFLANIDHKSSPPGASADAGARIGLASAIMSQIALSWVAAGDQTGGWICLAMAAITAGPTAYLAAVIVSRQRRAFAAVGGQAGQYIGYASLGSAAAITVYLCCGQFAMLGLSLGVMVMIALAATLRQTLANRSARLKLIWGFGGGAAILFGIVGVIGGGDLIAGRVGSLRPGVWLTSCTTEGDGGATAKGFLRYGRSFASDGVSEFLDDLVSVNAGRWLVVGDDERFFPRTSAVAGMSLVATCDPTACGDERRLASGITGDFFASMAFEHEQFAGVLIASLPADHSQAERLFNETILKRCAARKGIVAVRTCVGEGNLSDVLQTARAFELAVGSGWAVVEFRDGGCEMLLVGPEDFAGRMLPIRRGWMYVVPLNKLWKDWNKVAPKNLISPPAVWNASGIDAYDLRIWLEKQM